MTLMFLFCAYLFCLFILRVGLLLRNNFSTKDLLPTPTAGKHTQGWSPCYNTKYSWSQILCRIHGKSCTLHRNQGENMESMKPNKTYIHIIWCDPIKFTMENVSNHGFYVLVFWVLRKWNLIAQHKLFFSNHISCSAQLLTFPGCLKETQKVFFQWYYSENITTFDENNVD